MSDEHIYWDEWFVNIVRIAITDEVIVKGRRVTGDLCECAAGVVAMQHRFFFDPKRWALREKAKNVSTSAPLVEVRCDDLSDVSDVVHLARVELRPLKKNLTWREDIFE